MLLPVRLMTAAAPSSSVAQSARRAAVPGYLAHAIIARGGVAREHHDVVALLDEMSGERACR